MNKPRALSTVVLLLPILAAMPFSRAEDPPQSPRGAAEFPWGETVSGLQCRLIPDRDVYRPDEEMMFYVQLRNAGDRELRLDSRRVFEQRLRLDLMGEENVPAMPDGIGEGTGGGNPTGLVLPRPGRLTVLAPGGIATFTLCGKSRYDRGTWFLATWLDALGEDVGKTFIRHLQKKGRYRARFSCSLGTGDGPPATAAPDGLWTGRVDAPPVEVSIRGKRLEDGDHEEPGREPDSGKSAGNLRTFLTPFEPRVAAGVPCWFRLRLLNDDRAHARMYAPPVGILGKGGLQVTDGNAQPVPFALLPTLSPPPLQMVNPGRSVVLCDFDLAAVYDLSKPGRYRVQFPATGGKQDMEVVLPASNSAEIEIVEKPLVEIRRSLEPPRFTIRGTVRSENLVVDGASVVIANWEDEGFVRVPSDPEQAPGARRVLTDKDGRFSLDGIHPGAYWVVARQKELGSALLTFQFVNAPAGQYDLTLLPSEVLGQVLDKDGRTPLANTPVMLSRPEQNRRWVQPVVGATDGNGRFWFPGMSDGTYWVKAFLAGSRGTETAEEDDDGFGALAGSTWSGPSIGSEVKIAGAKTDAQLVAPREKVVGTVRTRAGPAVPNAHVELGSKGGPDRLANHYSTKANGKGEFLLDGVVPGDYTLTVTGPPLGVGGKAGSVRHSTEIQVGKGEQEKKVEIVIDTPPAEAQRTDVFLQLEAPDGKAVGKQRVRYTASAGWSSSSGRAETDGDGVLRINVDQAPHDVLVILADAGLWGRCTVTPVRTQKGLRLPLRLQKTGSAEGRVVEEGTNRPLGGVLVHAAPASAPPSERLTRMGDRFGEVERERVSRDGDGTFRLSSLPPGEYVVSRPWHNPGSIEGRFTVKAGDVTKDVIVRKRRDAGAKSVRGQLLDTDGVPVAGREFVLTLEEKDPMGLSHGIRRAVTDEQGRFVLYPVPSGSHQYRVSLPDGSPGPIVSLEVKPDRDPAEITFRLVGSKTEAAVAAMGPPDPPGPWGTTVDGWRTRVTPLKGSLRRWEPAIVKVEIENLGNAPRHYYTGRLETIRPDGKPVRCVDTPVQTMAQPPLAVAPGQTKEWQADLSREDLSVSDLTMAGKYRVRYVSWRVEDVAAPPPSNVAEFEVLPHDPKSPLPPIQAALPPGLIDALDSVIPVKWELQGVGNWRKVKPDFSEPRHIYICYQRNVSTDDALKIGRDGMQYLLFLYDLRYEGQDPVEKHRAEKVELRLLGQTDWYRVYAAYRPDARLGWKDPDGDIIRALSLKRP